jgi:hypothetical protein
MNVEEIRLAFQDTETRRTKLALLSSELEHALFIADRVLREVPEATRETSVGEAAYWSWATRYPTTVIESLLGDVVALLANHKDLWSALAKLRDELRSGNAVAEAFGHFVHQQEGHRAYLREPQHERMRRSATAVRALATDAKTLVDAVLSGRETSP